MTTKTATKKSRSKAQKDAPQTATLPDVPVLPPGQEQLPDGSIRLKTGNHKLGETKATYDIAGVKVELSGDVLVASKDVDWLSIGTCAKCRRERPEGVRVRRVGDSTVLIYTCASSRKKCDLGGLTYVQVHSPGRFIFE